MSGLICRLCLNMYNKNTSSANNFQDRSMLKFTFPQIILGMTGEITICSKCMDSIKEFYNFKRNQINISEEIITDQKRDNITCLICQTFVTKISDRIYIDSEESLCYYMMCCGFNNIVSKENNYICKECEETVNKMYDFLQQCITVQGKLHKKMKILNCVLNNSDLVDIVMENQNNAAETETNTVKSVKFLEIVPKESLFTVSNDTLIKLESYKIVNVTYTKEPSDNPNENINIMDLNDCQISNETWNLLLDDKLNISDNCDILTEANESFKIVGSQTDLDVSKNEKPPKDSYITKVNKKTKSSDSAKHLFKCTKCCFRTDKKPNFQRHLRSVCCDNEYKINNCTYCEFKTKELKYLKSHIKCVHENINGALVYYCEHCEYSTLKKRDYSRHLKCKHKCDTQNQFESTKSFSLPGFNNNLQLFSAVSSI